jgi:hypothetical protein
MAGIAGLESSVLLSLHEHLHQGESAMIAYVMMAVLAVLAFLCFSHVIPGLARRKK